MATMTVSKAEAELMLRVLRADDASNRENDLEREPEFEELDAKLVCIVRDNIPYPAGTL